MKPKPENERQERQDWGIVFLILFFGFLCVAGAGQWALRLSPAWTLDTNVQSGLNPNIDFLTRPVSFVEPVDSGILTQPAWVKVFLTPGARFATGTPLPAVPNSTRNAPTAGNTALPGITLTVPVGTGTVVPTNTLIWYPPVATNTKKPGPKDTPIPPLPNVNLGITQSDGTNTYVPGGTLTYTVTVTNTGPSGVNGAIVTDTFTGQVTGISWSCVAVGTTCGAGGPGTINDVVNLPVGASITYTVNVNINPAASGDLIHTTSVSHPAGYTGPSPVSATDTNTPVLSATLGITITDGVIVHTAGAAETYTIVVSNTVPGSSNVIGATVTDNFAAPITSANWSCAGSVPTATCGAGGSGNINDLVNLPFGTWVTYTVSVTTSGGGANLVNTASASLPVSYSGPSPVSATDTDTTAVTIPPGDINVGPPDGNIDEVPQGQVITLAVDVTAHGDGGWDLVYYEMPAAPGILMDWVRIEVGDGNNWYTVFDWGNGAADNNTNVAAFSPETDQLPIPAAALENGTGVAIDIDSIVPYSGTYPYLRITSSPYGAGTDFGRTDIDAIEVFP